MASPSPKTAACSLTGRPTKGNHRLECARSATRGGTSPIRTPDGHRGRTCTPRAVHARGHEINTNPPIYERRTTAPGKRSCSTAHSGTISITLQVSTQHPQRRGPASNCPRDPPAPGRVVHRMVLRRDVPVLWNHLRGEEVRRQSANLSSDSGALYRPLIRAAQTTWASMRKIARVPKLRVDLHNQRAPNSAAVASRLPAWATMLQRLLSTVWKSRWAQHNRTHLPSRGRSATGAKSPSRVRKHHAPRSILRPNRRAAATSAFA